MLIPLQPTGARLQNWEDDFSRRAYGVIMGGMWPALANSTYPLAVTDQDGNEMTDAGNRYQLSSFPFGM